MPMKKLNRYKVKIIIFSALLIIFGILFCLLPESAISVLGIIISVFLIAWGVFLIFGYCVAPKELQEPFELMEGVVLLVVGIVIDLVPTLFVLAVGLVVMCLGLRQVFAAWTTKNLGEKYWYIDFTISFIIFVFGLLISIFCGTKIAKTAISIMLGIDMIISGIFYLVLVFVLHRKVSNLKAAIFGKQSEKSVEKEPNLNEFTDFVVKDDNENKEE